MVTVTYRHKFNYREFQEGRSPVLQFRLTRQDSAENAIDVDAYLDSGAEGSLFNGFLIAALGIELINDRPKNYRSTVGGSMQGYIHTVRLDLPGVGAFDLEIGFSTGEIRRNLLGRNFFALAQIGFRENQLEYYLTPVP